MHAGVTKSQIKGVKLIANDELGSRCLKGQWGAKCNKQGGEEVSMETLEAGTTPRAATNGRHRHTE